jgi:hypothetical protein
MTRCITGLLVLLAVACDPGDNGDATSWRLVEELRIGADSGSEMTAFTDIRAVVAGTDGRIFVLEMRPPQIRVFNQEGRFLSLAAREGQGPGEVSDANGMLIVRDTIWVNDPQNRRWSAWSAVDGRYIGQVTLPIMSHSWLWDAGVDAEGRILDPIMVPVATPGANGSRWEGRLQRVRSDGTIVDTVALPECEQRQPPVTRSFTGSTSGPRGGGGSYAIPFVPRAVRAFDGKGGIWCSPNDEYLLVYRTVGTSDTVKTVRRPYSLTPVSAPDREAEVAKAKAFLARYEKVEADYSLIPAVHPVFDRLQSDDAGRLWARRSVSADSSPIFDVYDATGAPVASVTTAIRFVPGFPVTVQGDRVYGVVHDADEVQQVVRARIVRSPE